MKYVDKIIFRNKETYNKLYQGSELLYEVNRELDYLTFKAIEPSTILYKPSTVSTAQYSFDKVNWKTADNITLNLNTSDKVYFKGNITGRQDTSDCAKFTMTGKISASGSIMSMQAGNPQDKSLNYYGEFVSLFWNCTSLINTPKLPAMTLTQDCYSLMFNGCTSLITAPSLPATTLAEHCYSQMFNGCTSLVNVPDLAATTLAVRCYSFMFNGCSSLVNAPALPATTLAEYCYDAMFYGCTRLVNAPALPATTLASACYSYMFYNCRSLKTAPALPATKLILSCYHNMFNGCRNLNYIKCAAREYYSDYFKDWVKNVAPTGDFYCYDSIIFPRGNSGIPTGWTEHIEVEYN